LHCLRDRLTIQEAIQLGDQLPMLVRGIYYEGWRAAGKPEKIRSREEFLARVAAHLPTASIEPEHATRAVFQVLHRHVAAGEVEDVLQTLPKDISTLRPTSEARQRDVA
jgi:uncharacterized protein (DUF2267 family)